MKQYLIVLLTLLSTSLYSQDLYFPPIDSDTWETTDMDELGWCDDSLLALYDYLENKNSKAFIVLKDGKIVIEKYFDTFTADSLWYWASAGKTITAFLTGIAKQEGELALTDPTSDYLGTGWTNCTAEQEAVITVWHQLTMTSGLYDDPDDPHCTDPECLIFEADAGTEWAYHNAPYTLLDEVIAGATGFSLNMYANLKLEAQTGMSGTFVPLDYNNVYFSKPRDMARFGLMMLNGGSWDTEAIMTDETYYNDMINTSQDLNKSYGYLWWLNGKTSFMLPSTETVFDGPLLANAPSDTYAAIGKNGQVLNVVPSQNLVIVRMGEDPGGLESLVPTSFNNTMWRYLNYLFCEGSGVSELEGNTHFMIYPNPTTSFIRFENTAYDSYTLFNHLGQVLEAGQLVLGENTVDVSTFKAGTYYLQFSGKHKTVSKAIIID